MDDNFKSQLDALAKEKGKSVNELIINYLRLGKMVDHYTDKSSIVSIRGAVGFEKDQPVIVPVKEIVGG